jgi:hypothetical protein
MASLQGYVDRQSLFWRRVSLANIDTFFFWFSTLGRVLLILQDGRAIVVRIILFHAK